MHARYYSHDVGRFLSVDPVGGEIGSSQSWNRYSYVRGNPIGLIDRDGRNPVAAFIQLHSMFRSDDFIEAVELGSPEASAGLRAARTAENVSPAVVAGVGFGYMVSGAVGATIASNAVALNQAGLVMTELIAPIGAPSGIAASGFAARALQASDLGIAGKIDDLTGTISMENGKLDIVVDMIKGDIENPLAVMNNIVTNAKAQGATSVEISGVLANERLLKILQSRYGAETIEGTEKILLDISKSDG